MIYSNFPTLISPKPIRHEYGRICAEIRLGESGANRREIWVGCTSTRSMIYNGMNENLNFCFSRNGKLILKEYEEDFLNFEDPRWNIPDNMFLMLTSLLDGDSSLCRYGNGIIQTLSNDALSNFGLYARGNGATGGKYGKNGFWFCGIYRVMTEKPSIVRIIPAGHEKTHAKFRYLLIHNNNVTEYVGFTEKLKKHLDSLKIDLGMLTKWGTL